MLSDKAGVPVLFALLALAGCDPGLDGDWLGTCGDAVRVELRLRTAAEEPVGRGRAWVLARPDDVLDFRCVTEATGREVALTRCQGGWLADGGSSSPLDLAFDAEVESTDRADALAGTCSWEGVEGATSMIRILPAPAQTEVTE